MKNKTQKISVEEAIKIGAEAALKEMEKLKKKQQIEHADRRFKNTKLLLRNYNNFIVHCDNAIYTQENMMDAYRILQENINVKDNNIYIESILRTKHRTNIMVQHIKNILAVYKFNAECSADELAYRRYDVVSSLYIECNKTIKDLAEQYFCDVRTIQRDRNIAIKELSVMLFGIDGMRIS